MEPPVSKRRLLIIINEDWFLVSHRLPLALAAKSEGWEVHIATRFTHHYQTLSALDFQLHHVDFRRGGASVSSLIRNLLKISGLFWRIRPNVTHLVTLLPVLVGGIAAKISPTGGVLFAISGMGHVFTSNDNRVALIRFFVKICYQFVFRIKNKKLIFQNDDDRRELCNFVRFDDNECVLIRGSGVDLEAYKSSPIPPLGKINVAMISRLLWTKGVGEYLQAAERLSRQDPKIRFFLAGGADPSNPASLSPSDVDNLRDLSFLQFMGHLEDSRDLIANSHIIVLPSYREGLPKVLIEASASGRAIITTDAIGCRDAVEHMSTGILIETKSVDALVEAISFLVRNPSLLIDFGRNGRLKAEREFDINEVTSTHLALYNILAVQR